MSQHNTSPRGRIFQRLTWLGLGCAALLLATPARAEGPARPRVAADGTVHITVRAKRVTIPPLVIEQVGVGETRVVVPASGKGHSIAFTMVRGEGALPRFSVANLEVLD
jgi:hypothetical protein